MSTETSSGFSNAYACSDCSSNANIFTNHTTLTALGSPYGVFKKCCTTDNCNSLQSTSVKPSSKAPLAYCWSGQIIKGFNSVISAIESEGACTVSQN